jgi:hypothetical protein
MKSPPQPIIAMAAAAIGAIVGGVVVNLMRDPISPTINDRSMFDGAVAKMALDDDLEKELAPIRREQAQIINSRSIWDENRQDADHENRRFFVVGCERDRLERMKAGVINDIDCRKVYDAQHSRLGGRAR